MPKLVIIVGCPRSGTSALCGLFVANGWGVGGPLIGGDTMNELGYFEDKRILEINDKILATRGIDWRKAKYKDLKDITVPDNLTSEMKKCLSTFDWAKDVVIKECRLSHLLPLWLPLLPKRPIVLLPIRNLEELLNSYKKMWWMDDPQEFPQRIRNYINGAVEMCLDAQLPLLMDYYPDFRLFTKLFQLDKPWKQDRLHHNKSTKWISPLSENYK
ncbi:MAG: hypothetical protein Q8K86_07150 [Candidatus Nanopelagicaceae bacterium]|nr:hypothetical protein [Candidatus Nanopelagicaceae bacterium]